MQDSFIDTDMPDFYEYGDPVCSQTDPEIFFSKDNFSADGSKIISSRYANESGAKTLCKSCPYAAACLQYALENPELRGIWGGTTEKERNRLQQANRLNSGIIELSKTR